MEKFEPKSNVRIFQYHPIQIKKGKFHLKKI